MERSTAMEELALIMGEIKRGFLIGEMSFSKKELRFAEAVFIISGISDVRLGIWALLICEAMYKLSRLVSIYFGFSKFTVFSFFQRT